MIHASQPRHGVCLIISVYDNLSALQRILQAVSEQTRLPDQVIVSEDGENSALSHWLTQTQGWPFELLHLTQADRGFRKNLALNRAIAKAKYDWLVFIDGDCVPHPKFIAAHDSARAANTIATGRRVELGPRVSRQLIRSKRAWQCLSHALAYWTCWPVLLLDQVKNPEAGINWAWLDRLKRSRSATILGCNFSCSIESMKLINGFNEDFLAAGVGEDSDLQWRFEALQMRFVNLKFSALQYHLHHPRSYQTSSRNWEILEETRKQQKVRCEHGLERHLRAP